jgi:hypothetical protein
MAGYAWSHILVVVFSFINVSMHIWQRSPSAICICVSVSGRISFEIYISGNKGFGDSGYEFSLCISRV